MGWLADRLVSGAYLTQPAVRHDREGWLQATTTRSLAGVAPHVKLLHGRTMTKRLMTVVPLLIATALAPPAVAQGSGDCRDVYAFLKLQPMAEARQEASRTTRQKALFIKPLSLPPPHTFPGLTDADLADPVVKSWSLSGRYRSSFWPDYPCGNVALEDVMKWGATYNLELLKATARGRFRGQRRQWH